MASRHEYRLDLTGRTAATPARLLIGAHFRPVQSADLVPLAELMLDAYRDTVDYEGESLPEAVREVEHYFSPAAENPALLGPSVMVVDGESVLCACLMKFWRHRSCPLVGYVICRAEHKGHGLATSALHETLRLLRQARYGKVRAVITEGNAPSERLFLAARFERV
jgi:RimJ/RimL family protein N-acetyltransferase